jgi:peptidoglycan hydrolase CwlO-like protein
MVEADLGTLQRQIDAASAQLTAATERIQQVAAENNALRQEITRLRQQLASQKQLHEYHPRPTRPGAPASQLRL